jgi:hypothetical protein
MDGEMITVNDMLRMKKFSFRMRILRSMEIL